MEQEEDSALTLETKAIILCSKCMNRITTYLLRQTEKGDIMDFTCPFCKEKNYLTVNTGRQNPKLNYCTNKLGHRLNRSVNYCVTCSIWFCNECVTEHLLAVRLPKENCINCKCSEHPDWPYDYFCIDCRMSLCIRCLQAHLGHSLCSKTKLLTYMKSTKITVLKKKEERDRKSIIFAQMAKCDKEISLMKEKGMSFPDAFASLLFFEKS